MVIIVILVIINSVIKKKLVLRKYRGTKGALQSIIDQIFNTSDSNIDFTNICINAQKLLLLSLQSGLFNKSFAMKELSKDIFVSGKTANGLYPKLFF